VKCAECNSEVSIADNKCPKCGHDLLQFGSTTFYEPNKQRYGQGIKNMFFGRVSEGIGEDLRGLDKEERMVFSPATERLAKLLCRHISEDKVDEFFYREILPALDDFGESAEGKEVSQKVEDNIRHNLGMSAFDHYGQKGPDVLKILRAGELVLILLNDRSLDIDLSIKMFPYFKASEKACSIHARSRYRELKDNQLIKEISLWLGRNDEAIVIGGIPAWLISRRKTLIEVINGILTDNDYFVGGSLRTGIAIYVLGRTWDMKVRRSDLSREKSFQINNILGTGGVEQDKELLAENLQKLQVLRNERMHKDIEGDDGIVQNSRTLSYQCLKELPGVLII
jgi:hypothetical protein